MTRATKTFLLALVFTAGCRSAPAASVVPERAPAPPRTEATPARAPTSFERLPPDTALVRLHAIGRGLGDTRARIRRTATGCTERAEAVPNRHGHGTDSLFHLSCEGVRFVLRQAGVEERREFLETTVLARARPTLPVGLTIGATDAREVRQRLGVPHAEERAADTLRLTYRIPLEGADEFVQFHLVRDILRRVAWAFYVD